MIPETRYGSGRKIPEAANPDAYVDEQPRPSVPAPTVFTSRFAEVEKAAKVRELDLASKVQDMTVEDNPGLLVLEASPVPVQTPMAGTTIISLSDTSSSSETESPSAEVAVIAAEAIAAPSAEIAAIAAEAIAAVREKAQADTEKMEVID